MDKIDRIRELALKRRSDRLQGFNQFGDYHGGIYDQHDYVVPWTISACNCDAELMIMGQDWNSHDNLSKEANLVQARLGQIPELASNKNLKILLERHCQLQFEQTFATDLFPFVKKGGMSGYIPSREFMYAALIYALPQIGIIRPKVVVALGARTYNALRKLSGYKRTKVSAPWDGCSYKCVDIIGVTHTGGRSINAAHGLEGVKHQWELVSERLRA